MKTISKLEFLENELKRFVKEYQRDRLLYRNFGFIFKLTTVLFYATITVLLGLRGMDVLADTYANIALILGALITVISAADAFFDFRSLWMRKQVLYRSLQEVERELNYYKSGMGQDEIKVEQMTKYLNQLNSILRKDMEDWMKTKGENVLQVTLESNQEHDLHENNKT
jgi:hypothetical protein